MGRKKKYDRRSEIKSISFDPGIIEAVEKRAEKASMTFSAFVNDVLKQVCNNDSEYCKLKARKAAQDLSYWQSRAKVFEDDI